MTLRDLLERLLELPDSALEAEARVRPPELVEPVSGRVVVEGMGSVAIEAVTYERGEVRVLAEPRVYLERVPQDEAGTSAEWTVH